MIRKILAAVDDSPSGLAAGRAAIDLAEVCGAELCLLARPNGMAEAGELSTAGSAEAPDRELPDGTDFADRRRDAAAAMLRHVSNLAKQSGVTCQSVQAPGRTAERVLLAAHREHADVIVLGVTTKDGTGRPYIDVQVQRVLEFTAVPVLVVPQP